MLMKFETSVKFQVNAEHFDIETEQFHALFVNFQTYKHFKTSGNEWTFVILVRQYAWQYLIHNIH